MSNDTKFARVLGSKDVIALAFGAMVGWGWVVLAGTMISNAGTGGTMLAFAIGGTAVIMIGLAYAELASAMPQNGGEHVYTHRAMGAGASFFCTWAIILGYVSVVAFEAVALPTVLEQIIPGYKVGLMYSVAGWDVYFTWAMVGIVGAIGMTWLNIRGVKASAMFQAVITVLIIAVGLMLISGSLFNGSTANTEPLFVGGMGGIFSVIIMTPFLFVGFDVIPQAAEEIDLPFRKIGIILIVSVLMAVAWYILIMYATGRALDADALAATKLATADAATAVLGGSWAGKLLVLAGLGGILTSWNAFLIGGSRAVYAMAEAKMLPAFLAKLHPTYKTPVNAILLIGALSIVAPLFGRQAMVWLVDAGGLGIVVAYSMVALAFIVLRKKEPGMERPFRAGKGPWVGYVALILSLGLVLLYTPIAPSALLPIEWVLVGGWSAVGLAFYAYSRKVYGVVELKH